jgi:hypothetical protein
MALLFHERSKFPLFGAVVEVRIAKLSRFPPFAGQAQLMFLLTLLNVFSFRRLIPLHLLF